MEGKKKLRLRKWEWTGNYKYIFIVVYSKRDKKKKQITKRGNSKEQLMSHHDNYNWHGGLNNYYILFCRITTTRHCCGGCFVFVFLLFFCLLFKPKQKSKLGKKVAKKSTADVCRSLCYARTANGSAGLFVIVCVACPAFFFYCFCVFLLFIACGLPVTRSSRGFCFQFHPWTLSFFLSFWVCNFLLLFY